GGGTGMSTLASPLGEQGTSAHFSEIFPFSRGARTGLVGRFPPVPMKYRTYLIFGAPGSGKGTQGKILGAIPRFFHCACGDVFRSLDTRTSIGQAFLSYSSRGELVPDEITVKLWM